MPENPRGWARCVVLVVMALGRLRLAHPGRPGRANGLLAPGALGWARLPPVTSQASSTSCARPSRLRPAPRAPPVCQRDVVDDATWPGPWLGCCPPPTGSQAPPTCPDSGTRRRHAGRPPTCRTSGLWAHPAGGAGGEDSSQPGYPPLATMSAGRWSHVCRPHPSDPAAATDRPGQSAGASGVAIAAARGAGPRAADPARRGAQERAPLRHPGRLRRPG